LRLHDLRHTGLTLAAATGATTAELMHRAVIRRHLRLSVPARYQNRDRVLADALGEMINLGSTTLLKRKRKQGLGIDAFGRLGALASTRFLTGNVNLQQFQSIFSICVSTSLSV